MSLLGKYEGHIVDPTYTAKSFAAIPALVMSGRIPKGSRVVFIHTGGLGAVFAYQEDIRSALTDVWRQNVVLNWSQNAKCNMTFV